MAEGKKVLSAGSASVHSAKAFIESQSKQPEGGVSEQTDRRTDKTGSQTDK